MSFVSLMKPSMWAITPGLVPLEWQWFWGPNLQIATVFWAGQGVPVNYVANPVADATIAGSKAWGQVGTSQSWGAGTRGTVFTFSGTNTDRIEAKRWAEVGGTGELSGVALLRRKDSSSNNRLFNNRGDATAGEEGWGWNIIAATDTQRFTEFGVSDLDGTKVITDTDWHVWGFSYRSNDTCRFFTDGVFDSASAAGTIVAPILTDGNFLLGAIQSISGNPLSVEHNEDWGIACLFNTFLTDAQHVVIARDPFGPFRMAEEARVVYDLAAVAAGLPDLVIAPYIPA